MYPFFLSFFFFFGVISFYWFDTVSKISIFISRAFRSEIRTRMNEISEDDSMDVFFFFFYYEFNSFVRDLCNKCRVTERYPESYFRIDECVLLLSRIT